MIITQCRLGLTSYSRDKTMRFDDLTGNRYGKLTVIKRVYKEGDHNTYWLCKVVVYLLSVYHAPTFLRIRIR